MMPSSPPPHQNIPSRTTTTTITTPFPSATLMLVFPSETTSTYYPSFSFHFFSSSSLKKFLPLYARTPSMKVSQLSYSLYSSKLLSAAFRIYQPTTTSALTLFYSFPVKIFHFHRHYWEQTLLAVPARFLGPIFSNLKNCLPPERFFKNTFLVSRSPLFLSSSPEKNRIPNTNSLLTVVAYYIWLEMRKRRSNYVYFGVYGKHKPSCLSLSFLCNFLLFINKPHKKLNKQCFFSER